MVGVKGQKSQMDWLDRCPEPRSDSMYVNTKYADKAVMQKKHSGCVLNFPIVQTL